MAILSKAEKGEAVLFVFGEIYSIQLVLISQMIPLQYTQVSYNYPKVVCYTFAQLITITKQIAVLAVPKQRCLYGPNTSLAYPASGKHAAAAIVGVSRCKLLF